jgi:hypothetical protein
LSLAKSGSCRYHVNIFRAFGSGAIALAILLTLGAGAAWSQQPPNCTAAPYNVPAGLPTNAISATQDQHQMACQLGIVWPTPTSYPPLTTNLVDDPYRPINAWPSSQSSPNGNWTDAQGHTVVRNSCGAWTFYDSSISGGAAAPVGSPITSYTQGTSIGVATSGLGDRGQYGTRPYPTGNDPLYGVGGNSICTSPGCLSPYVYPSTLPSTCLPPWTAPKSLRPRIGG